VLAGKSAQAERAWEKSLSLAKHYAIPFDEALVSRLLGLLPNHADDEANADAIFARLDVTTPINEAVLGRIGLKIR